MVYSASNSETLTAGGATVTIGTNLEAPKPTAWNPAEFAHWYQRSDFDKRVRAWEDLTSSQRRLFLELDMFRRFARAASIKYTPETELTLDPNSTSPPPPDIMCQGESGPMFFELGEIVEQGLAAAAARAERERAAVYGGPVDIWRPLLRIFSKKVRKRYFQAAPLYLILYYGVGRQSPFWPFVVPQLRQRSQWLQRRVDLGPFASVWVYDAHGDELLATVPQRSPGLVYLR